tara:strand:- start:241 stop:459 length:219 start_codon:yes stop_codon:yes gene_type:complete
MRTTEEINEAINIFCEKERTEEVEAILDVLENKLNEEEIEQKYFDENDPWTEQTALSARQFLDGEIGLDEIG